MGRWNCGNRPPGDSDHQVSYVFAIGTWQEKKRNAVWSKHMEILSVTVWGFNM